MPTGPIFFTPNGFHEENPQTTSLKLRMWIRTEEADQAGSVAVLRGAEMQSVPECRNYSASVCFENHVPVLINAAETQSGVNSQTQQSGSLDRLCILFWFIK